MTRPDKPSWWPRNETVEWLGIHVVTEVWWGKRPQNAEDMCEEDLRNAFKVAEEILELLNERKP